MRPVQCAEFLPDRAGTELLNIKQVHRMAGLHKRQHPQLAQPCNGLRQPLRPVRTKVQAAEGRRRVPQQLRQPGPRQGEGV